jgi:hypothetical protein
MDEFRIGLNMGLGATNKSQDFSDVDPSLFGETLAKEMGVSTTVTSLGATVQATAPSRIEQKPPIVELKSSFSDKEIKDLYSLVNKGFEAAMAA